MVRSICAWSELSRMAVTSCGIARDGTLFFVGNYEVGGPSRSHKNHKYKNKNRKTEKRMIKIERIFHLVSNQKRLLLLLLLLRRYALFQFLFHDHACDHWDYNYIGCCCCCCCYCSCCCSCSRWFIMIEILRFQLIRRWGAEGFAHSPNWCSDNQTRKGHKQQQQQQQVEYLFFY